MAINLVSIDAISKVMRDKLLFEQVSFGINAGEKIGLIGDNGTGKSTLLRILAGEEMPDNGALARNSRLAFGYLEQVPHFDPQSTVLEYILHDNSPVMNLIRTYESALKQSAAEDKLSGLIEEMDKASAWDMESKIKSLLSELGITEYLVPMGTLSGGMFKKVALCRALVSESDLLLLDEPTNHLDIDTIDWLEEYLVKSSKAVVIITHDRYFLDTICDYIYELYDQRLMRYDGNYSFYLEKKAEYLHAKNREQERIGAVLKTELEWLKRGPRARRGKSKERTERIVNLMEQQDTSREVESEFSVTQRRLGKKILELKGISRAYDTHLVIKPFSYIFKRGERIGIIGPNGSGKTTFLKLITGQLAPDTGTVDAGINTAFGFFDQLSEALDSDATIIEYIKETADYARLDDGRTVDVAQVLERFSFTRNMLYTKLRYLSGGEKRRLYLVKVLITAPNFLVLDEPTNNFDLKTLSMLEDFLNEFPGCFTCVSHDRYFLDRTVDFLFIFDGKGNIFGFGGNYSQYLDYRKQQPDWKKTPAKGTTPVEAVTARKTRIEGDKKKLTFKEKKEYDTLVIEIEQLEKEHTELEAFFSSGQSGEKLKAAHLRYNAVKTLLEEKMARWSELAAFAE